MNETTLKILRVLADGDCYSGEALGDLVGVSRASVWKVVQSLQSRGVDVLSLRSQGYQIVGGLELLDGGSIYASVNARLAQSGFCEMTCAVDVQMQLGSTNQYLLARAQTGDVVHAQAVLVEEQSLGRGRRGREWHSGFAKNICLSLGWRFESGVAAMQGLSLAVGLVVARALERVYGVTAELKWPNDILLNGKKLGGVLLEVVGDLAGECLVVVGIGLNLDASASDEKIDQPWTDIKQSLPAGMSAVLSRNKIAEELLVELSKLLANFESQGFSALRMEWESRCGHIGRQVRLVTPVSTVCGVMSGVSAAGELILNVGNEDTPAYKLFSGGEVSLRLA